MSSRRREDSGRFSTARRNSSYTFRPSYREHLYRILDYLRRGYSYSDIMAMLGSGDLDLGPSPGGGGGASDGGGRGTPRSPDGGSGGTPRSPDGSGSQPSEALSVKAIDFQVALNTKQHHTDEFDITEGSIPQLVVRRGQPFTVVVRFSRALVAKTDDFRLIFEIGQTPQASKGTKVVLNPSKSFSPGQWGAQMVGVRGAMAEVKVISPPDCIVGKWSVSVKVAKGGDAGVADLPYKHDKAVYMLFNPWCREDVVHNDDEKDLEEHVLNDKGEIFVGSYRQIFPRDWVFGQFSGDVLESCMYLLDVCDINLAARGNAVKVVRKLSAIINSPDDNGVLAGNWSGDYDGGVSPLKWSGSAAILEKYYKDKRPVKFGQCWVFSGVFTTVCRALGIPCRSVTNFASAHDTDDSITIDVHVDKRGEHIDHMNGDSIWNFHVWNEVWMSRRDLPSGNGGWQVCDATPQEASDNVYQCGPCPVRAIKEGEVNIPYDGSFIFAEVNADRVIWEVDLDGTTTPTKLEKNIVGKKISTRGVYGGREDITHEYKYPEGSPEERKAVRTANQAGTHRPDIYEAAIKDVDFQLTTNIETIQVGEDFVLTLQCTNKGQDSRTISGMIIVRTMYYTGIEAEEVGREEIDDLKLWPRKERSITLTVKPERYQRLLKDGCNLSVTCVMRVFETGQVFNESDTVILRKPRLNIKAPVSGKVGEEFEVEISFTNPMTTTLTECELQVEGSGVTFPRSYPQSDVAPKSTFFTKLKLKPFRRGSRTVVFIFGSKELEDINGEHKITISP